MIQRRLDVQQVPLSQQDVTSSKSKTTCFTINNAMLTGEKCHVTTVKQVVLLLEMISTQFEEASTTV